MKIFGREPALVLGVIVAVISLFGTLGFSFLSSDQAGLWVAAVNAVAAAALAWTTRPLSPGVFSYAVASIIALATGYGLEFTSEQVNAINGLLVPVLTLLTRGQVSPIETVLTKSSKDPTVEAAAADGTAGAASGYIHE